jgi:outer membrane protein TolC
VGQISELEKLNAQSQYKKIELTFKEALNQFSSEQIRFSFLIGNASLVRYKPQEKLNKFQDVMDTNFTQDAIDNNPTLAVYNQALKVSRFERRTEYFKLFPGLVLGYLNQGESNSPLLYRFKIGISVPLWAWNHAGRLRSQDRLLQESEAQRDLAQYDISSEYGSALEFYKQHKSNLQYYENLGLKEAEEIIRSAKESYKLGAITYYNYLQNIELAFQIQLGYLDTLKEYNTAWLKLQYLSGN